ncbi:hypothetical protein D3C81_2057530 [compost metagenome]
MGDLPVYPAGLGFGLADAVDAGILPDPKRSAGSAISATRRLSRTLDPTVTPLLARAGTTTGANAVLATQRTIIKWLYSAGRTVN